jgi:hypothetical protein
MNHNNYKKISNKELYAICKKYGSLALEARRKFAGMSKSSVDDALRIMKKVEDKPELKRVVEEKGLNSVRPVLSIATKENQKFWAEKARNMGKNTLETYVKNYRSESRTSTESQPAKVKISMEVSTELLEKLKKMKGEMSWSELLEKLVEGEGENKSKSKEKPIAVKTKSRHIPQKIRQYVLRKTGGMCAYPGCNKKHSILHHTQRFALEKIHDPDKIVPLCIEHERLAHLGLIENEDGSPEKWKVKKEPDRTDHKQFVDQIVWLHR